MKDETNVESMLKQMSDGRVSTMSPAVVVRLCGKTPLRLVCLVRIWGTSLEVQANSDEDLTIEQFGQ